MAEAREAVRTTDDPRATVDRSSTDGASAPDGDAPPPTMVLTYEVRLRPTRAQHDRLRAALRHGRDLYNAALQGRVESYAWLKRTKEVPSAPDRHVPDYVPIGKDGRPRAVTLYDQNKALTELRRGDPAHAAWPATMQRWPLKMVDLTMKSFFDRCRAGKGRAGFPRIESAHRWRTIGFTDRGGWSVTAEETDGSVSSRTDVIGRIVVKGVGSLRFRGHRPLPSPVRALKLTRRGRHGTRLHARVTEAQRALARLRRKEADARATHLHRVSASITRRYGTVVVEDLDVRAMTRSAKGTINQPGTEVGRKAGLNREMRDAALGRLRQMLVHKAGRAGGRVPAVDPRRTSTTCAACKHADGASRRSQSTFVCTGCGHRANADANAAANVLARGRHVLAREVANNGGAVPAAA